MTTDEQKYKAYTFNIAGFALMTPLGKVFLDYVSLFRELGLILFIINFIISLLLFIGGLTFVEHGRNILQERRKHPNADRSL